MAKTLQMFVKIAKNHDKIMAMTRHQIMGPKTITESIKLNILH